MFSSCIRVYKLFVMTLNLFHWCRSFIFKSVHPIFCLTGLTFVVVFFDLFEPGGKKTVPLSHHCASHVIASFIYFLFMNYIADKWPQLRYKNAFVIMVYRNISWAWMRSCSQQDAREDLTNYFISICHRLVTWPFMTRFRWFFWIEKNIIFSHLMKYFVK